MFSEGVSKGRIDPTAVRAADRDEPGETVRALSAEGHDRAGHRRRSGRLWDPHKRVTITNAHMQQGIDYTPYEGLEVIGWPVATVKGGRVVMRDGKVQAEPGTGQFLPRAPYDMIRPRGVLPDGFDASAQLV